MDTKKAREVLEVTSQAGLADVQAAFERRQQDLTERLEGAPADALKAKFQQALDELVEAKAVLEGDVAASSPSPLTQTKLDDLPGAAPQMTQMGEQIVAQLHIKPGDMLAGRYQIKEQIGAGGMGAVYRAHDGNRGEDIAIKVLLPSLTRNERALSRFLDEARLSSKLSHPNIVNVFDVQNDGERSFITMELLEGQTLRQLMDNRRLARQPFSEEEVLEIASSLSGALSYAHQHTVHRDIKPENVFLTEDGDYKLMDFGIARLMSNSARTQTGAAMGTAYYMAPEQLRGAKDVDGRADQYSVAVLLYELLTGEVPAGMIQPLREQRKDVSKGFSIAVMQAMANQPDRRFADMASFVTALGKAGSGVSLPSVSSKAVGIAAGVLLSVSVVAAIAVSPSLRNGLVELLPAGSEERQAIKNEALTLQGKAKSLKQRVDVAVRAVSQTVKDRENAIERLESSLRTAREDVQPVLRKELEELRSLLVTEQAVDGEVRNILLAGDILVDLESRQGLGEAQVRDKEFDQARSTLAGVVGEYKRLFDGVGVAGDMYQERQAAEEAGRGWQSVAKGDQLLLGSPPGKSADGLFEQAESARGQGQFVNALKQYQDARLAYQALSEAVPVLQAVEPQATVAKVRWDRYAREKGFQQLPAALELEQAYQQAMEAKSAGEFVKARQQLEALPGAYGNLLVGVQELDGNQQRAQEAVSALEKMAADTRLGLAGALVQFKADYEAAVVAREQGHVGRAGAAFVATDSAIADLIEDVKAVSASRKTYQSKLKLWSGLEAKAGAADKDAVAVAGRKVAEAERLYTQGNYSGASRHYADAAGLISQVVIKLDVFAETLARIRKRGKGYRQSRFTESGRTFNDARTGLIWQDNSSVAKKRNWYQSMDYCDKLVLGGRDDWRLPSFQEMTSLFTHVLEDGRKVAITPSRLAAQDWRGSGSSAHRFRNLIDGLRTWPDETYPGHYLVRGWPEHDWGGYFDLTRMNGQSRGDSGLGDFSEARYARCVTGTLIFGKGSDRVSSDRQLPNPQKQVSVSAVKAAYLGSCVACHGTGIVGAPIFRDRSAWRTRAAKGVDALLRTTIMGKGNMPARGGSDASDEVLRAVVEYMLPPSR